MDGVPGRGEPRPAAWKLPRPHAIFALLLALAASALAAAGCSAASAPSPTAGPSSKPAAAAPSAPAAAAAPAPAKQGYAVPDLLVETDWLAQNLSDPGLRIVDARKADDYRAGHLKGAVSIPQDQAFLPGAAQGILGTGEQIARLFGARGISNDSRVVIYGAGQSYDASYLLWALEVYGHSKVSVLNGGIAKWKKENRDIATTDATAAPATLTVKLDATKRSLLADVKAAVGNPGVAFVDARAPEEYRGDQANAKRGGHIPGAVNVNWVTLFNADGTVKPGADLARLYEEAKVTKDRQAIAYCQVGFRSSMSYLSLRLLGYRVGHYDASWNEWGNDTTVPVEK